MPSFKELLSELSAVHEQQAAEIKRLSLENDRIRSESSFVVPVKDTWMSKGSSTSDTVASCDVIVKDLSTSVVEIVKTSDTVHPFAPKHQELWESRPIWNGGTTPAIAVPPRKSLSNIETARAVARIAGRVGLSHLKLSRFVMNPSNSAFMRYWDTAIVFAIVWVAIVVPLQVGILETRVDVVLVVSSVIDFIFLIDMGLQFFIMYSRRTDFGYVWEHRLSMIAANYFRGWFVVDIVSVFPFDVVAVLVKSDNMVKMKVVKLIRLLRLLKLLRVMKVSRFFRRCEVLFTIAYQKMELYKFFVLLILVSHWLACSWALTLAFVGADEGIPRWIDAIESNDGVNVADSPLKIYSAAIYFVAYTITSVGYGDIGPKNDLERVTCTFMIYICGFTWAYVLGQICGIVSDLGLDERDFRKSMDDLNSMMEDRNIGQSVRKRLRVFFLETKQLQRRTRQRDLLSRMSPALQGEFAFSINRKWMAKLTFLQDVVTNDFVPAFVVDLALAMKLSVYAQSEVFGRPFVLYIMNRGVATRKQRLLRVGAVWGEDFVLSDKNLVEMSMAFAFTYVEVSHLEREDFFKAVGVHEETYPPLKITLRRAIVRLIFRRAIIREAQRRRHGSRACVEQQSSGALWLPSLAVSVNKSKYVLEPSQDETALHTSLANVADYTTAEGYASTACG
eukprot:TRINITY_DN41946_c0_g1_i1.p1 TRINITY_DN41946_c0_g1~~TRINITY_DN41946_c0_g1_i1.p1  ORF type:complete len:685 (-),score=103.57 TRINITY_DN41946_c0_g1_i1:15-2039(-)